MPRKKEESPSLRPLHPYDADSIFRFINAVFDPDKPPDQKDMVAAANALMAVIYGNNILKELGLTRKRGQRFTSAKQSLKLKSTTDIGNVPIESPFFGAVLQLELGEATYGEVQDFFCEHLNLTARTAQRYIQKIRPRAARTAKFYNEMWAMAPDN